MSRVAAFVSFMVTVWAANWAVSRYGVVPIGIGLTAPAGVYFAGLSFGLRDALHELGGYRSVLAAIFAGGVLSYVLGDGGTIPGGVVPLAAASAVAFAVSESVDLLVYAPLRRRHWAVGVVASNLAGAVVDSSLFLWLAFGNMDHLTGNVVGKSYMTALSLPLVWGVRRALSRHTIHRGSEVSDA